MSLYETERLLDEYLLFHYGTAEEILPYPFGPRQALGYPVRCVTDCVELAALTAGTRALDLGCAVGRAAFELARQCAEVIGIDFSRSFIAAAEELRARGERAYARRDEGELTTPLVARVPAEIERRRVRFEVGDAEALREDLGEFDVVLMANLIDRLRYPAACLARLPGLVRAGGQLVITSPYTWLTEHTPRAHWLGGFERSGRRCSTLDGLSAALGASFELRTTRELPFLIREHARKFQWSVAQASLWRRRGR